MIYRKIILIAFSATLWLMSCNKEGLQGIKGPGGSAGAVGAVGPAGKNGSTFLKEDGAPDAGTGEIGDYYLDEAGAGLYGPKTDDGWGDPFTFSGREGGKMYGGNGVPGGSTGVKGDFYLDTAGYTLYGPKQDAQHWGPGIYLNGSGGSTGVTEYIINNPNDYFTNGIGDIRYNFYLHIPNDDDNNFNPWKNAKEKNELIKVYLKQKITVFNTNEDSVGFYYSILPAAGAIGTAYYSDERIEAGYSTAEDGLYINFFNSNRLCECSGTDLLSIIKSTLGLFQVRVYVISPSATKHIYDK